MEDKIIQPLIIKLSQLPHDLAVLPDHIITKLYEDIELLTSFVKSLPEYEQFNDKVIGKLNDQISKLNDILVIFEKYQSVSKEIEDKTNKLNLIHREFLDLETIQYKLLSSNFNQDYQKLKFQKLINKSHENSLKLVESINYNEFDSFLKSFKSSRKVYHLRMEKMNRWNEERITGFV
ncbi:hypothetical protein CLIB1444_10S01728 [[Candida] jaroonii]|uniref:Uncharacterized protein n=1 Tax=[Candida] jaroonii TaxID=467808 RepID=A0ACA9YBY3_9ASCO|nr:hypothetical protein CLIB1444_10S01728 [[Candida] jaroonii]